MSKTNKKSLFGRFQNLAIAKRITLIYGGIFSFSLLLLSGFFFVNTTILEQNSVRKQLETTIVNIERFLDNGGTLTDESLKNLLDNKYVEVSVFSYSENEGFNSHVGEIPAFIKQPPQLMNENTILFMENDHCGFHRHFLCLPCGALYQPTGAEAGGTDSHNSGTDQY